MRRGVLLLVALALLAVGTTGPAWAARIVPRRPIAHAPAGPTTVPPPPPPPKAWILVDDDTGAVVDAGNDRVPLPPASVFKVMTALIAVSRLTPDDQVPVSTVAEGMPARKVNMKAGQVWAFDDVLHSLLLVSANDAAVALAERVDGSLAGFAADMDRVGQRLGLADQPVLHDPAGLDDEFSFEHGNLISARDLAIVTRAAMAQSEVRAIVSEPDYRFHGADGNDHRLLNHNLLLKEYPGAIGVKTGYTKRAGHSLIGEATRDGRTMLSVVIAAPDPDRFTMGLLDKGFATPVAAEAGLDRLPPVVRDAGALPTTSAATAAAHAQVLPGFERHRRPLPSGHHTDWTRDGLIVVAGALPALLILWRRRVIQTRRRRRPLAPAQPAPTDAAPRAERATRR